MDISDNVNQAAAATRQLEIMGFPVIAVSIKKNRVVIRIDYCRKCDNLIRTGKANYLSWGTNKTGQYKQGYFDINNTRVIWSESLK